MRTAVLTVALWVLLAPVSAGHAQEACPQPSPWGSLNFDVEYVMWFLRRGYLPPVLTTGTPASQGVLGQPGTHVLYGDTRLTTRHDNRFFGTRFALEWTEPEKRFGIEARAFFLERDSTYYTLKHRPEPLLALSYVDARTGRETSEVVAGSSAVRGPLLGGFVGYSRIELFGEEANLVVPVFDDETWKVDLLAGARFLQMRDRYHHTATTYTLPDRATLNGVIDNVRVHNAFYGGQLGLRAERRFGRLYVQMRGAVALGADDQLVRTFGERVYHTPQERTVTPRGLFIQPSNTGSFSRVNFDAFGEIGVNLGWQLTPKWRALVGYTYFWWADPMRAASQIDRVVDTRQEPGASRPGIPFRGEAFWGQGLNFGLECRW